ncbi:MAG: hypothetical protein E7487_08255 [Ruminococcaceae bacterium]|nr:hypothetical protein [Oscillospiraceae bacterium]
MDWGFAGSVTITGVVVVFSVLLILLAIIMLAGSLLHRGAGKKEKTEKMVEQPVQTIQPAATVSQPEQDGTIAAISAAVAYMMETYGLKEGEYRIAEIKARRLRRSAEGVKQRSAWSAAGIKDAIR